MYIYQPMLSEPQATSLPLVTVLVPVKQDDILIIGDHFYNVDGVVLPTGDVDHIGIVDNSQEVVGYALVTQLELPARGASDEAKVRFLINQLS